MMRRGTILACSILLGAFPQAGLAQSPPAEPPALTLSEEPVITLGDLRDLGLCINQIQQQAKNIFMEATRRPVPASAEPELGDLKSVAYDPKELKGKFEHIRPEWITYYVGTLEPVVHLLKVNLDKSRTQKLLVPEGDEKKFRELMKGYDAGVEEVNALVTNIYEHVADESANVAIAQEASKLYDVAGKLETDRRIAFRLIKKAKQNGQLKEVILPAQASPQPAK